MEINGLTSPSTTGGIDRFGEMTSEDFLRIMFAELNNQDPLDPQDSGALLEQIDSLRSIQSNVELMDRLDGIAGQNQFASAGSLLGMTVVGLDEFDTPVQGTVVSVSVVDEQIMLTLDNGSRMRFDQVETITAPPADSN